jgi:hypothetical protein
MRGYRRRRWVIWFFAWFFGTLALIVVGLSVQQLLDPSPVQPCCTVSVGPSASPSSPALSPASPPPAARPSRGPALTGPVQVMQGRQQVNGVELGFPHSTVGAVSAADAAATEIVGTLDPDRAAAVMRMVADPSFPGGPQQAAGGAVNDRKSLGIPASGPVPPGDSFLLEPMEVQVRDVAPDQVTVLLLADFTTTVQGQGTQVKAGVFPVRVHWAQGDWKVLPTPSADYGNLSAEPDSAAAASLGWQQLNPAGA